VWAPRLLVAWRLSFHISDDPDMRGIALDAPFAILGLRTLPKIAGLASSLPGMSRKTFCLPQNARPAGTSPAGFGTGCAGYQKALMQMGRGEEPVIGLDHATPLWPRSGEMFLTEFSAAPWL